MEFARSKKGIFVSQRKYVLDLLGEIGLLGCKTAETPIEPNLKLEPAKLKDVVNKDQFQRLVWETDLLITYTSRYSICY